MREPETKQSSVFAIISPSRLLSDAIMVGGLSLFFSLRDPAYPGEGVRSPPFVCEGIGNAGREHSHSIDEAHRLHSESMCLLFFVVLQKKRRNNYPVYGYVFVRLFLHKGSWVTFPVFQKVVSKRRTEVINKCVWILLKRCRMHLISIFAHTFTRFCFTG